MRGRNPPNWIPFGNQGPFESYDYRRSHGYHDSHGYYESLSDPGYPGDLNNLGNPGFAGSLNYSGYQTDPIGYLEYPYSEFT
jgi:hypothetical protein